MTIPGSSIGWTFSLVYVVVSTLLIVTQGLFGESFIALILGLPWSLLFSLFEFGGASGIMLYVFVLAPIVLNAAVLYWFGAVLHKKMRKGDVVV